MLLCSIVSSWLQGPVSDDSDSVSLGALCSSVALSHPGYKGLSVTTVTVCHLVLSAPCSIGSSWLQGPVSDNSDSVSLGALCSSVALARPGYKGLSVTTVTVCHLVLCAPL